MQKEEKKPDALLHALLDFISSYREMDGGKPFFKNLDEFFSSQWKDSSFIVYSHLREKDLEKPVGHRLLWNRDKLSSFPASVLKGKIDSTLSKGYYIFCLGEEKFQKIFGVLKTDEKIEASSLKYLNNFFITQQEKIKELKKLKRFEHLVDIDSATGLFNQQKLFKDIQTLIDNYQTYKENFAVLFIDVDHFKLVNEKYGHLVGSETLSDFAKLLKTILRDNDLTYRYGGDEFVVILKDVIPDFVKNVAERILQGIQKYEFHTKERAFDRKNQVFHISASIGVSIYPQDVTDGQDILLLADKRMYQAKDSGRAQICDTSSHLGSVTDKIGQFG